MKTVLSDIAYKLNDDAKGYVTYMLLDEATGSIEKAFDQKNKILFSGADVLASALAGKGPPVNMMYLEFQNTLSPVVPEFERAGGLPYYTGLVTGDVLRVPLLVSPDINSTDESLYVGNKPVFIAVSELSLGAVNSLSVVDGSSTFIGAALVASEDPNDMSKDKVFSRVYFDSAVTKTAGKQLCIIWNIIFS